jgi:hypothetical protein
MVARFCAIELWSSTLENTIAEMEGWEGGGVKEF